MQACSNGCQLSNGKPRMASRTSAIDDRKRICRQCAADEDALDERTVRQRRRMVAMRMTAREMEMAEDEADEGADAVAASPMASGESKKKTKSSSKKKKRKADHDNDDTGNCSRRQVKSRIDLSLFTYPGFFCVDHIPPQAGVVAEVPTQSSGNNGDSTSSTASSGIIVGEECGMDTTGESARKIASSTEEDVECATTKTSSKEAKCNPSAVGHKTPTKRITPKRAAKRDMEAERQERKEEQRRRKAEEKGARKTRADRPTLRLPAKTLAKAKKGDVGGTASKKGGSAKPPAKTKPAAKFSTRTKRGGAAAVDDDAAVPRGEIRGQVRKKRLGTGKEAVRAHAGKKGDLPLGVYQKPSGQFVARIQYSGTKNSQRYIGTFDTPDQAFAAYTLVKDELDKDRSLSAKRLDGVFEDAKLRALVAAGKGGAPWVRARADKKEDLPRGVRKKPSGRFQASIRYSGTKNGHSQIGTFDTPEQASAAYTLVRGELDKNRSLSAKELDGVFEDAKTRALQASGEGGASRVRAHAGKKGGLPRGVYQTKGGRFQASIKYSGRERYIGLFDTPEQASAAYTLVQRELDKNRSLSAKELDCVFEDAKTRALEAARIRAPTGKKGGLPCGVREDNPGRFVAIAHYSGTKNAGGYIGTFDTPEQASAAYTMVRGVLDNNRSLSAEELDGVFEGAKARAVGVCGSGAAKTRGDLPLGVKKTRNGRFEARIKYSGTKNGQRHIGTFDTPEQASAAYILVKNELNKNRSLAPDELDVVFEAAKAQALKAAGVRAPPGKKGDLPLGVYKTPSGRFIARIQYSGTTRQIGVFDTPEQASDAYTLVRDELNKNRSLSATELVAVFEDAKARALEAAGVRVPTGKKGDLPRGVYQTKGGRFEARAQYSGRERYIGTFDTLDQASAAYTLVRGELDNNRPLSSDQLDAVFEDAKARALEAAGDSVTKKKGGMPRGIRETSSGRFDARIQYSGTKNGYSHIGTFDTAEQASAAYTFVRNELDKDRSLSAKELDGVFEVAKARATQEAFQAGSAKRKKSHRSNAR